MRNVVITLEREVVLVRGLINLELSKNNSDTKYGNKETYDDA